MSFLDSLLISVFGLGIVFVVLIALSGIVSIESKIFLAINGKKEKQAGEAPIAVESRQAPKNSSELKLSGVDERTAAIIMAIVSDESKIPLSELQFKSIKAMD